MKKTHVSIGCASAFWGDTPRAAQQLIESGAIDYLVFDFLAETTMALLAMAKMRQPEQGYAPDFLEILKPLLGQIKSRKIRVLANAGGLNPIECKRQLQALIDAEGLSLKVGAVTGDDLQARHAKDSAFQKRVWGQDATLSGQKLVCFNAYLGAEGLVAALDAGCDIIITGRVVDSALVLAPLVHHFQWSWDDYHRLAQGSLAGHIIECGAQCTGGNFTDWLQVPHPEQIGFPIVECYEDGSFIVTKPAGTGGLVNFATVCEQIVYEIDDPASYKLPNVICDFRNVQVEVEAADRVRVCGAKGRQPSGQYKACGFYLDGYRANALLMISGHNAHIKARAVGKAILDRVERCLTERGAAGFEETLIECLGSGEHFAPDSSDSRAYVSEDALEIVLRVAVAHKDKTAVADFCQEIAQAATGMGAGIYGVTSGRPQPSPRMGMLVAMVDKELVPVSWTSDGEAIITPVHSFPDESSQLPDEQHPRSADRLERPKSSDLVDVPLYRLAYARSGDKGNHANIGVIARKPEYWPWLREELSAERVHKQFRRYFSQKQKPGEEGCAESVQRWEMPGIMALNFLLKNSLGGGGMASLQADAQGKSYGQQLLQINISIPRDIL
ncbi:acyclic terpene utilization AtuA family protein [Oligoflexus tunisiensis]|uniref:acyclic terpene utilization AtuA family protein n=1 Tax=Oligoflexus tunisiensis TaxID=708132 RepID=UPI000AC454E3|nr:acyclic terpene utilization AtuA family protein [Oligoflexus tunisiensis]